MSRGRDIDDREKPAKLRTAADVPASASLRNKTRDPDRDDLGRGRGGDEHSDRKPADKDHERSHEQPIRRRTRERHEPVRSKERTYVLAERDLPTLQEIGKFRAVTQEDLEHFRFEGDRGKAGYDLRRLSEQGLITRRIVTTRRVEKLGVIALTREGKSFLDRDQRRRGPDSADRQQYYSDVKKPAEIFHDSAIYRMYEAEATRLQSSGGRIRRVILDYELKKKLYRPLARARAISPEEYSRRQEQIAPGTWPPGRRRKDPASGSADRIRNQGRPAR